MSLDEIKEEILYELEEIDSLFKLYQTELFDLDRPPNLLELTGFASVLHSFYNGVPAHLQPRRDAV